ncbi:MAG TPA: hypothetical protein VJM33_18325 [Microthrixaceae bacterium]|nr:hypothetical protein [Microthrixaceae bacterium]
MGIRRVVTPFVIVFALLAGGSMATSCTTLPSGEVAIDQQAAYNSGVWVSLLVLGVLVRIGNPFYEPTCKYCLGIL